MWNLGRGRQGGMWAVSLEDAGEGGAGGMLGGFLDDIILRLALRERRSGEICKCKSNMNMNTYRKYLDQHQISTNQDQIARSTREKGHDGH